MPTSIRVLTGGLCFSVAFLATAYANDGRPAAARDGRSTATVDAGRHAIGESARRARTGSESAIRDLADQLFQQSNAERELAAVPTVKERVIQAEIRHHHGAHRAIVEGDIVRAINGAADRLALPEFAHTSQAEVRRVRMRMLPLYPSLMAPRQRGGETHPAVNEEMSPLEAFFITATLVNQKRFNEDFQQTETERAAAHAPSSAGASPIARAAAQMHPHRIAELQTALDQSSRELSANKASAIVDEFMTSLGIAQLAAEEVR
jgi:hypothetical protein